MNKQRSIKNLEQAMVKIYELEEDNKELALENEQMYSVGGIKDHINRYIDSLIDVRGDSDEFSQNLLVVLRDSFK